MTNHLVFSWINLISLNLSALIFSVFSIISVMPVTLSEKRGERAWKECFIFRIICFIAIGIMVLNMIFWIFFPVEELNWVIHINPIVGVGIGLIIIIPCSIIMYISVKHGGKEHVKPEKGTKMHGGIYKYVRHPGAIGEMPTYIAIGFLVNSWFLVIWATIFAFIYTPIAIHFEEKDLVKRFGESYREYQRTTRALIPQFKKKNE